MKNDEGIWQSWDSGLESLICDYFTNIFTSNLGAAAPILDYVSSRVTKAQNEFLLSNFTAKDVQEALFAMHPDKSQGPDGLNPAFYQRFWPIIGNDISRACLSYIRECFLPAGMNDTLIVLIPKVASPESIHQLRPIALCNVIYKIMSKMLALRMKKVLSQVISHTQSVFLPQRLILGNVIIAYEVLHHMKRHTQGKHGLATLKLDMSKAFDRVEWSFLR